jgi:hypothetical protein
MVKNIKSKISSIIGLNGKKPPLPQLTLWMCCGGCLGDENQSLDVL